MKEAIAVIPLPERNSGFYRLAFLYFTVPKKDGGIRPIIDLHKLNHSLRRFKFKMMMLPFVVSQLKCKNWFVTINLKERMLIFISSYAFTFSGVATNFIILHLAYNYPHALSRGQHM